MGARNSQPQLPETKPQATPIVPPKVPLAPASAPVTDTQVKIQDLPTPTPPNDTFSVKEKRQQEIADLKAQLAALEPQVNAPT